MGERLMDWRDIGKHWNWEVWPEWDEPGITHPAWLARQKAQRQGWAGYYRNCPEEERPDAERVLKDVKVWHFSGRWDTAPWMLHDEDDADAVRIAALALFQARDPGGVVATALFEWRRAF